MRRDRGKYQQMRRVGIFGWGVVAPGCATVDQFAERLDAGESWLQPFTGFGPSNFLAGTPSFSLEEYRAFIVQRHSPSRYKQIADKVSPTGQYALGAFIQALAQNPGLEPTLREVGTAAHVYIGSCFGALETTYDASIGYDRALRRWNRFWAAPERNAARRDGVGADGAPVDPAAVADPDDRLEAEDRFNAYWAARSEQLAEYLRATAAIDGQDVGADVEAGKLAVLRDKSRRQARLLEGFGAPTPPWNAVSANLLWNVQNSFASQISMLAGITGPAFAPSAACSTFGVALNLAMHAIRRGDATVAVVGATDPAPHPLTVATFNDGRVCAADGRVSKPLSGLRGTHIAGGAAVWIVADVEWARARGFSTLGLELLSVGLSSDADHIITPSREGPQTAVGRALAAAGVAPAELGAWDLHATATPGDHREVVNIRELLPESVLLTARKGTFGHGMGVAGGWELTAQHLGVARGRLHPTTLALDELHPAIGAIHQRFVLDQPVNVAPAPVGKLSMGVGGINACVLSRPWA